MFNNTEDDDKENLYDGFEPEAPKAPKPPKYTRDDPRYWDQDEGEWDHLIPSSGRRKLLIWGGSALIVIVLLWITLSWISGPYVQDAVQYGYVDHIEQRGNFIKTYEGTLIPYKSVHDTTRSYEGDFTFSTSDKLGATIRAYQNSGKPLRVEYRTYRYALPWRGENKTVVIRVDTVSTDSILPYKR